MKKTNFKQKIAAVGAAAFGLAVAANAAITAPTPDYTDFEAIVGVALGVTLIVMLARKAKGFFH